MADHRVQTPGYDGATATADYPHATERSRARSDRTIPAIVTIVALLLIVAVIILA